MVPSFTGDPKPQFKNQSYYSYLLWSYLCPPGANRLSIRARLPVPVHLDQLDSLLLFHCDIGVQLLDSDPGVVLGVGQVAVGGPVEDQLEEQQVFLYQ
jgi:hypothetical protein